MASKGVTGRHFGASVQRTDSRRGMPPRVFWEKSSEVVENKGSGCEREREERQRVGKSLTDRELRVECREGYARFFEITRKTVPQIWTFVNSKL